MHTAHMSESTLSVFSLSLKSRVNEPTRSRTIPHYNREELKRPSMSKKIDSCLWTSVPQSSPAPCDRYKHAICAYNGNVYLLGGRWKHSLKDFWKYNVVCNKWIKLDCDSDNAPDELEEHSMVSHQGVLYIFGGLRDSAYSDTKTPLWLFDTAKENWFFIEEQSPLAQNVAPANRKGHSAVVLGSSMFIYGGYIDMRGTSQEFWKFNLAQDPLNLWDTQLWCTRTACCFSVEERPRLLPLTACGVSILQHVCGRGCLHCLHPLPHAGFTTAVWVLGLNSSSISKSKDNTFRPFKNKCFPSSPLNWKPEEDIELQSLSVSLKSTQTYESCLTFENQVAQGNRYSEHSENETEDTIQVPMPDLLLIVGGKPLKDQAAISVWQMTLGD